MVLWKDKIDKFLARLIRGKKESPNNKNHKQKRRNYNRWQRNTKDHKRVPSTIIRQQINLEETHKFMKKWNKPIASNKTESVKLPYPKTKAQVQRLHRWILPCIERRINIYPSQIITKYWSERNIPNSFYKARITPIWKPKTP